MPSAPEPSAPKTGWLEVSLKVDGELAEAVAEVLSRYAPDGVMIEASRLNPQDDLDTRLEDALRVCAYLPVQPGLEEIRRKLEEALWYLGRIRPLPEPTFRMIEEENWAEAWKVNYRPIPIGERLMVLPAWLEPPAPGRIPLRIDPGMAFGTGTHPSTRLCLELVENYVQPGQPVIDLGCGSGILAIAALLLGAGHALGVDIDADSLPEARLNAERNGVHERIELGLGSLEEVRRGDFSLTQSPLVLVNILAPVIVRLLDDGLAELLSPGGVLVLAGILDVQLTGADGHVALLPALARHGLRVVEERRSQDWVALVVAVTKT